MAQHYGTAGGGGGGECLQGNLWYSPPASMTPRLASVTFKMASKVHVFIEETDKNFDLIMEILFRFLGLKILGDRHFNVWCAGNLRNAISNKAISLSSFFDKNAGLSFKVVT